MRSLNMLWLAGALIWGTGALPTPQQEDRSTGLESAGLSEAPDAPLDEREQLAEASMNIGAVTIWYVDDDCVAPGSGTEADPFCLIQDCIDAATDGDECVVAPGTYFETINFLGKAITLSSTDPSDPAVVAATVIDATGLGQVSVVSCNTNEGSNTILDGFTITGGTGTEDDFGNRFCGGMYNSSSSPTVSSKQPSTRYCQPSGAI